MNKEERDFLRWMLANAKTEKELERVYEVTEHAFKRKPKGMQVRNLKTAKQYQ